MSEDYTYPPTPRMVRAEELDAMRQRAETAEDAHNRTAAAYDDAMDRLEAANVRAEATKRERDAWQRNAAMWHDKAEAAEAKLRLVDEYAEYCILCVDNRMFYDPFDVWFDEQGEVEP